LCVEIVTHIDGPGLSDPDDKVLQIESLKYGDGLEIRIKKLEKKILPWAQ